MCVCVCVCVSFMYLCVVRQRETSEFWYCSERTKKGGEVLGGIVVRQFDHIIWFLMREGGGKGS